MKQLLTSLIIIFILFSQPTRGQTIRSIKKEKVLISYDQSTLVSKGQSWESLDKSIQVEILAIRPGEAVAKINSGKPQIGQKLVLAANVALSVSERFGLKKFFNKKHWGVLTSIQKNDMQITASQKLSMNLKGVNQTLGVGVEGIIDSDAKWLGYLGLEQLKTEGESPTPICQGEYRCYLEVNYLSIGAEAGFNILGSMSFPLWVSGGFYFLSALSKKTNILDESQISTNQCLRFSLGTNLFEKKSRKIPLDLVWSSFLTSQSVKAQQLILRFGFFW